MGYTECRGGQWRMKLEKGEGARVGMAFTHHPGESLGRGWILCIMAPVFPEVSSDGGED
jgi:hypothetical protein